MDLMFYIVAGAIAIGILLVIAEPQRFMPEPKEEKKLVGCTYWGIYEGTAADEPETLRTIEIKKASRKEKYIAGGTTYAAGRGVRMSGM